MNTPRFGGMLTFALATLALLHVAQAAIITGGSAAVNGHPVSAFADVSASNELNAVGFQVSGAAVRNPGTAPAMLFLTLPSEASATGFNILQLDWNPMGHEPPGIYTLPHFDFHFYYASEAELMGIPPNQTYPVAPQYLPANYSQPGPTVPMMGGHSVDLTSPEFNGGVFTHTFIYGFYQGREIFVEPMLTQAYLEGLSGSASFAIRQPARYSMATIPSLIPGRVTYAYDRTADLYTISVGEFFTPEPVPEPGSLMLMTLGVPAVLYLRSRRRTRA